MPVPIYYYHPVPYTGDVCLNHTVWDGHGHTVAQSVIVKRY